MARWQKSPRRRRRQRGFPRSITLTLLATVVVIGFLWWLRLQLPTDAVAGPTDEPAAGSHSSTTPDIYGTRSAPVRLVAGVVARLVDRPDSAAPLALIITAPADSAENWSGVQSTLEKFGVGSLVVSPRSGDVAVRAAAELILATARRRSQPMAILAADASLDLAVTLGGESSLADRPLVLLAPSPRLHSTVDALIARAPSWLRRLLAGNRDDRLASWRGRVLVVRGKDDLRFDAVSANALAAGTRDARVLVAPGRGFRRAPTHPDQESWRAITDFIRGVVRAREEITVTPELPSADTSTPP